jgi:hypothetical protein
MYGEVVLDHTPVSVANQLHEPCLDAAAAERIQDVQNANRLQRTASPASRWSSVAVQE